MKTSVPFFRPDIGEEEINEVVAALRSGWLTSGPRVHRFEQEFAAAVGARHAVAVNSCTAALHLAMEALGLGAGQAVLIPTMTFAATAEVVRYQGAIPILVDCDPVTMNMDLGDAESKLRAFRSGLHPGAELGDMSIVGLVPVHVGGLMMDVAAVQAFARNHGLWIVEDAAHAFPAARRQHRDGPWQRCGQASATATCFSFYANKTITTGEGGVAVTDDADVADRMRMMSLHGLSHDAWGRYSGTGTWDYQIVAPGYKYNLTDIAAAIGLHQLARAEDMRRKREYIADCYRDAFNKFDEIEVPPHDSNCIHSWHLFSIRLHLDRLSIDRNQFIGELRELGVACSVHWRPLHLHPYYQQTFGYRPNHCPNASAVFERVLSLPIFPGMADADLRDVIEAVTVTIRRHRR